jgi:lysosomal alpha-mannosidase
MIHRRIQQDDQRGVGEPLNETGLDGNGLIVRGTHSVDFSNKNINVQGRASLGHMLFAEHLQFAENTAGSPSSWINANKATFSALRAPLPLNLHVVTLHAQAPTTFLLRVAHMFGVNEDDTLSGPASCDLATLFSAFTILSAEELVLPGTIPLTAAPVTTYQVRGGTNYTLPIIPDAPSGPGLTITLTAMQIRTFKIQVSFP